MLFLTSEDIANKHFKKRLIFFSECSKGFYGQECKQTCNYECDGCNNVDGFCDRGCRPGWRAETVNNVMYFHNTRCTIQLILNFKS